jgi:hypothetical protein
MDEAFWPADVLPGQALRLEDHGLACHLVALSGDATRRARGRFVKYDSTEENLRPPGGRTERYGPRWFSAPTRNVFVTSRPPEGRDQVGRSDCRQERDSDCRRTDELRRGFTRLGGIVQEVLPENPFSGFEMFAGQR